MSVSILGSWWHKNSSGGAFSPAAPASGSNRIYLFIQQAVRSSGVTSPIATYMAYTSPPSYGGVDFTLLGEYLHLSTNEGLVSRIWGMNEAQLASVVGTTWANYTLSNLPNTSYFNYSVVTLGDTDQTLSFTPVNSFSALNAAITHNVTAASGSLILTAATVFASNSLITDITFTSSSATKTVFNKDTGNTYLSSRLATLAGSGASEDMAAQAVGSSSSSYRIYESSLVFPAFSAAADTDPPVVSGISVTPSAQSVSVSATSSETGFLSFVVTPAATVVAPAFSSAPVACLAGVSTPATISTLFDGSPLQPQTNYKVWVSAKDTAASPNTSTATSTSFTTTALPAVISSVSSQTKGAGYAALGERITATLDSSTGTSLLKMNGVTLANFTIDTGSTTVSADMPMGGFAPGTIGSLTIEKAGVTSAALPVSITVPAGWIYTIFTKDYASLDEGSIYLRDAAYSDISVGDVQIIRVTTTTTGYSIDIDEDGTVRDITTSQGNTVPDATYTTIGRLLDASDGYSSPASNATHTFTWETPPPPPIDPPIITAPSNQIIVVPTGVLSIDQTYPSLATFLNSISAVDINGLVQVSYSLPEVLDVSSSPYTFPISASAGVNTTTISRTITLAATGSAGVSGGGVMGGGQGISVLH
jgi:hypothetical protein